MGVQMGGDLGMTPARAGTTASHDSPKSASRDDPRSRGDDHGKGDRDRVVPG